MDSAKQMKVKIQGFTLIEIMVVVVIISIAMGAVLMSFPDRRNDRLKEHSARFSALMSLVQDEAILQSRDFGLSINDSGYSFYRWMGKNWEVYSDSPFESRSFEENIKSEVVLEGVDIKLLKSDKIKKPQIVIFSSGEMTSFIYILSNKEKSTATIKFDAAGNLEQVLKLNDEDE